MLCIDPRLIFIFLRALERAQVLRGCRMCRIHLGCSKMLLSWANFRMRHATFDEKMFESRDWTLLSVFFTTKTWHHNNVNMNEALFGMFHCWPVDRMVHLSTAVFCLEVEKTWRPTRSPGGVEARSTKRVISIMDADFSQHGLMRNHQLDFAPRLV